MERSPWQQEIEYIAIDERGRGRLEQEDQTGMWRQESFVAGNRERERATTFEGSYGKLLQ